jgi:hypothetical protein
MRKRRDANRDRLRSRLKEDGRPVPQEFIKQGSYAMFTMVQDPDNDYDIDDGVYFTQASLIKDDATEMSPMEVKQMVCGALKDGRFKKQPTIKKCCVRVFYDEGYHVDMPIYRIRTSDSIYELASDDGWTVSRAADTEDWFDKTNRAKSPDIGTNGGQFRRNVRLLKKFARSRRHWKRDIATGFAITKLAEECFVANTAREDAALRDCMQSVSDRLAVNLEVQHPVTAGAMLTSGPDDPSTKFLRERLKEALVDLAVLDDPECGRKQALAAWDKVFNTNFFSARFDSESESAPVTQATQARGGSLRPAAVASGLTFPNRPIVPNKPAGFA